MAIKNIKGRNMKADMRLAIVDRSIRNPDRLDLPVFLK